MLSGCGWLDGSYVSVTPHKQQSVNIESQEREAANYLQLRTALEEMVDAGMEQQVIRVGEFDPDLLQKNLDVACRYVKETYPLGAYAVSEISWELGTSGGVAAVAVQITYLHDRTELQRIHSVANMEEAAELVADMLDQYSASVVMLVENYEPRDIAQLVEDYAWENPSLVMETPEVKEQTYPNAGRRRVLELKFSYQSSRESLRTMQSQVQRIFNSAVLYVSADAAEQQKYSQLYAFLMERFADYQIKTSLTPAYSLLNHGVGDSRSFAAVYAQMCREAGLECQVVGGTKNGEPWFWNMIRDDTYYYHVDLLSCREEGSFREMTDDRMDSYVWDYSAYPACTGVPEPYVPANPQQPSASEPVPADTEPAPTETGTTPVETETAPAETETTPAETEIIPTETTESLPPTQPIETDAPETVEPEAETTAPEEK